VFVDELDQVAGRACVVFSAHGVSPAVRADATGAGWHLDASLPAGVKVHVEARRSSRRDNLVALIGQRPRGGRGDAGEAPEPWPW